MNNSKKQLTKTASLFGFRHEQVELIPFTRSTYPDNMDYLVSLQRLARPQNITIQEDAIDLGIVCLQRRPDNQWSYITLDPSASEIVGGLLVEMLPVGEWAEMKLTKIKSEAQEFEQKKEP